MSSSHQYQGHHNSQHRQNQHVNLVELARRVMLERGLRPDYEPAVLAQVEKLTGPAHETGTEIRDLRMLPWCSIDNDDSRDLDQLTYAEEKADGKAQVFVAVADVDAIVTKGSPVDEHAQWNTTSIYPPGHVFHMLPERLCTDLTSLNPGEDRQAVIVSYEVGPDGAIGEYEVFRAMVHNRAKLAYNSVDAWLDAKGEMPEAMADAPGVAEQVKMQDGIAQRLREMRHEHGALELETIEPRAVMEDGVLVDMVRDDKNRAKELIEDFMIAANGVTTRYLESKDYPTFRRVVREPERWDRIEKLAAEYGTILPTEPDSKALEAFLKSQRKKDPVRFPDISLTIVKLMGRGEYAVQFPGRTPEGHFGLAVRNYSHSTAPNRRYPDIVTHRLLKAALYGKQCPYSNAELVELAAHCTEQEDAANRVERQIRKSAAALLLSRRIGETFEAIVTGQSQKGTWVRIFHPPVEGKLTEGFRQVDVGDKIEVRLIEVDIQMGFIDFVRAR